MKAVYKIGAVLLLLAILPVLIFLPFVKIIVVSDVASLFGSTPSILLDESYSLKELYELYENNKEAIASSGFSLSSLPENFISALKVPGITFLVLFALALLCMVLALFFVLFSKNKRGAMVLSALGAASAFGMNTAFNNIAKPLINGAISVTDLLGEEFLSKISGGMSALGSALMSILGGGSKQLIDIRLLNLSSAYLFMLLLFLGVILWSVAFTLMEWDKK